MGTVIDKKGNTSAKFFGNTKFLANVLHQLKTDEVFRRKVIITLAVYNTYIALVS
jgi:hypothetical protein